MRAAVFAFILLVARTCVAGELQFSAAGGDHLTVKAVAEQQQWVVRGDETLVAAVVDGRLIVESFAWPPGPGPNPDPGPDPDPRPNPRGPLSLIWIEETADRTPEQAAALTDSELRDAIRKAGWSLRIADVDVVDEAGNPPSDLAAYIASAKRDGVPRMFAVDAAGAEVFAGRAPANKDEFAAILKRLGLSLAGEEKPKYVRVIKEPEEAKDCPTGNCPVPQQSQPQVRPRIRLFR